MKYPSHHIATYTEYGISIHDFAEQPKQIPNDLEGRVGMNHLRVSWTAQKGLRRASISHYFKWDFTDVVFFHLFFGATVACSQYVISCCHDLLKDQTRLLGVRSPIWGRHKMTNQHTGMKTGDFAGPAKRLCPD